MSEPPEPRIELPTGYGHTDNRWDYEADAQPEEPEAADPGRDRGYPEPDDTAPATEYPGAPYGEPAVEGVSLLGEPEPPYTGPRLATRPPLDWGAQEEKPAQSTGPWEQTAMSAQSGSDVVKIGLWGSPQSGKTTYLAALRHATGATDIGCGSWNIYPLNDDSKRLLVEFTHALVHKREFPQATTGNTVPLQWLFVGDITQSRFVRRRLLRRGRIESRFVLDLIDVTGGAFAYNIKEAMVDPGVAAAALDHLTNAHGLIYLFDPIGEKDNRDSSTYVNRTIAELQQRFASRGDRYLPHHLSVCITKFDHPEIFQQARRVGLVNYGPDGMPRVLDEHAEEFFDALCSGRFWSRRYEQGDGSAQFIRQQLRASFDPRRIRYFVTSSIGFSRPPGWDATSSAFNPEDFANIVEKNGIPRIKGAIHPINVLEPLVSLQQQLTGRA